MAASLFFSSLLALRTDSGSEDLGGETEAGVAMDTETDVDGAVTAGAETADDGSREGYAVIVMYYV